MPLSVIMPPEHIFVWMLHTGYRGLFIISPTGILRQKTVNDLPVGRSVDEVLRLIKAFKVIAQIVFWFLAMCSRARSATSCCAPDYISNEPI
eukprot:1194976-Prorocentrum_minimum.AAC.3